MSYFKEAFKGRLFSRRLLVRSCLPAVLLLLASLVMIPSESSAQGYSPNPTITSVTISGTEAVVNFTVPSGQQYNWLGVAHDTTLVETDGTLADDYAECFNPGSYGSGSSSCTIVGIEPGTNYFELQTQITTAAIGCTPPAGQESDYPNGTGYCVSNFYQTAGGSPTTTTQPVTTTTTKSVTTTTTKPVTTTPTPVHEPGDLTFSGVTGSVEVRQSDGSWVQVTNGAVLHLGQEMRTGTVSKCTLGFDDGTVISIGYNSSFTPVQNTTAVKSSGSIVVDFISGILRWADPGYAKGYFAKLKVQYNGAILGVRGTDFVISRSTGTQVQASVGVHQGTLMYTPTTGRAITISAGTLALIYGNGMVSTFTLTNSDWRDYLAGV